MTDTASEPVVDLDALTGNGGICPAQPGRVGSMRSTSS